MFKPNKKFVAVPVVVGVLAVVGAGLAAAAGTAPTYKVCVKAGVVYGANPNGACPAGTTAVLINSQGPAGPQGPAGQPPEPDLSRVATLDWWGGAYSGGSYGFDVPEAISFDGAHIWVTNWSGNSVTELDASDGAWVQTLSGGSYGFDQPNGIAFDGTHIWVINVGGNSVTELEASDGTWVQTFSGG